VAESAYLHWITTQPQPPALVAVGGCSYSRLVPLLGPAAMLLSFDVLPEVVAEHDHWHTHEHLPERLSIPGFLRGTRWVSLQGAMTTEQRIRGADAGVAWAVVISGYEQALYRLDYTLVAHDVGPRGEDRC
jgi:hypothetical protein